MSLALALHCGPCVVFVADCLITDFNDAGEVLGQRDGHPKLFCGPWGIVAATGCVVLMTAVEHRILNEPPATTAALNDLITAEYAKRLAAGRSPVIAKKVAKSGWIVSAVVTGQEGPPALAIGLRHLTTTDGFVDVPVCGCAQLVGPSDDEDEERWRTQWADIYKRFAEAHLQPDSCDWSDVDAVVRYVVPLLRGLAHVAATHLKCVGSTHQVGVHVLSRPPVISGLLLPDQVFDWPPQVDGA